MGGVGRRLRMRSRTGTTVTKAALVLGTALAFLSAPSEARAFCSQVQALTQHLGCPHSRWGHQEITRNALHGTLNADVYADIVDQLAGQDRGSAADTEWIHFDNCRFRQSTAYIRSQYRRTIANLNPRSPLVFSATDEFGKLL